MVIHAKRVHMPENYSTMKIIRLLQKQSIPQNPSLCDCLMQFVHHGPE